LWSVRQNFSLSDKTPVKQDAIETFLRLFGCSHVQFGPSSPARIVGRVAWDDAPCDFQHFAVDTSQPALTDDALALAEFLHVRQVLDGDRIAISRAEVLQMLTVGGCTDWTSDRLNVALDGLEAFRVRMIDDGEEGDLFLLHE
jgi:hypothetical protein